MAARILVGDDDPDILGLFEEILSNAGFEVTAVTDGVALLRAFEGGSFDLVITDMRMPNIDGLAVLEGVKRLQPQTPVILVTGHSDYDEADLRARGAAAHLHKPLRHLDELTALVKAELQRCGGLIADGTTAT